jgi:hypothetical protein
MTSYGTIDPHQQGEVIGGLRTMEVVGVAEGVAVAGRPAFRGSPSHWRKSNASFAWLLDTHISAHIGSPTRETLAGLPKASDRSQRGPQRFGDHSKVSARESQPSAITLAGFTRTRQMERRLILVAVF